MKYTCLELRSNLPSRPARAAVVGALVSLVAACNSVEEKPSADASSVAQEYEERPRLILQITVDQLRADLPERFMDRFGADGFRYLYDNGTVFVNAHHAHANTETIVGHVTLATGAYPSQHGMVGNLWFDRETGFTTYNVEDARYPLLSRDAGVDQDAEIDPTQRAARSDGRSPAAILVPTLSDALYEAYGNASKRIAVSVKDRGAISMAGHHGTAYWFSKAGGEFVTSRYYLDRYPDWVLDHNDGRPAEQFAGTSWTLMHDVESYDFRDADDQPWETDVAGFGRTFPHAFGDGSSRYFTTWLTLSPAGDRLVLDFAKRALVEERLCADQVTDFLSVSLSSTDYLGHVFGPSSLEAEDNQLALDRAIAELLAHVDAKVGLEKTLIVLSADHGAPDAPGYRHAQGLPGGYIDPEQWDSAAAIERIKSAFGIEGELIEAYDHPYLYFSDDARSDPDVDLAALEEAVAAEIAQFDGVAHAVSSTAMRNGELPEGEVGMRIANNFHPDRSGDVMIVFEPHYFINDFDGLTVASTHGSPWEYDTHVPVLFAGDGVPAGRVERMIQTVDIAPGIAALAGIEPPAGAVGTAPAELLEDN